MVRGFRPDMCRYYLTHYLGVNSNNKIIIMGVNSLPGVEKSERVRAYS